MTTYAEHRVEDHEQFIFDQLLPLIVGYARASNTPSEVVALASYMCLVTVLQSKGLSRETMIQAIDGSLLPIHEAPEGLQ